MENLKGKIALITGVSRKKGVGFAIAQALAQSGVSVFLAYFRPYDAQIHKEESSQEIEGIVKEVEQTGSEVETLEIDLSLPESPKKLIDEVIKKFGKVDILINNACYSDSDTVESLDADSLDKHYAVNVRATLLLTTEFAKQFRGEEGCVISMTSGQGVGPMDNRNRLCLYQRSY
jgi:3-oxoacyl-[acyl-carrier protein] reductase